MIYAPNDTQTNMLMDVVAASMGFTISHGGGNSDIVGFSSYPADNETVIRDFGVEFTGNFSYNLEYAGGLLSYFSIESPGTNMESYVPKLISYIDKGILTMTARDLSFIGTNEVYELEGEYSRYGFSVEIPNQYEVNLLISTVVIVLVHVNAFVLLIQLSNERAGKKLLGLKMIGLTV